ncbi:MAG: copper amine oxidase N-terminal domain-containing protein [Armatimonadota bacterium]
MFKMHYVCTIAVRILLGATTMVWMAVCPAIAADSDSVLPPPSTADGILYTLHGYAAPSGSTLVPVRGFAEWCGATVSIDQKTRTILCESADVTIRLTLGSKTALVVSRGQSRTVLIAQPAMQIDGITLVPLRFAGEAFGVKVTSFIADHASLLTDYNVRVVRLSDRNHTGFILIHDVPPSDVDMIRKLLLRTGGVGGGQENGALYSLSNSYSNYVGFSVYLFNYNGDSKWSLTDGGWGLLRKKDRGNGNFYTLA